MGAAGSRRPRYSGGAVSDSAAERAREALRRSVTGACPYCHGTNFCVEDVVEFTKFGERGGTVPVVLVRCTGCQHLAGFSAVGLKAVPDAPEKRHTQEAQHGRKLE